MIPPGSCRRGPRRGGGGQKAQLGPAQADMGCADVYGHSAQHHPRNIDADRLPVPNGDIDVP